MTSVEEDKFKFLVDILTLGVGGLALPPVTSDAATFDFMIGFPYLNFKYLVFFVLPHTGTYQKNRLRYAYLFYGKSRLLRCTMYLIRRRSLWRIFELSIILGLHK